MKLLNRANGNTPRSEEEKQAMIEEAAFHYGQFLTALGFDWKADPNSEKTPYRYAKSFVHDLIAGCMENAPEITAFPSDGYTGIVLEKNIPFSSMCSHHHREISGVVHIAYIPGKQDGMVIGLSKMNRLVEFYSRRPQIQEGLTVQLHTHLDGLLIQNRGVAVIIEAAHGCVKCRGVKHHGASMSTSQLSGYFWTNEIGTRAELFNLINR